MSGDELREFISAKGYTTASFAARVGVSPAAIYKALERGEISAQIAAAVGLLNELEAAQKKAAAFDAFVLAVGENIQERNDKPRA